MSIKFLKTRVQLKNWPQRMPANRLERQIKKKKTVVFLRLGILAAIMVVGFFIYAPIFRIEKIVVSGINEADNLISVQLAVQKYTAGFRFGIWPKNNILFLNKKGLVKFVEENALVQEVTISKKFRILEIAGREKLPVLIWQEGEQHYYLDKNGWVMAAVDKEKIKYNLTMIKSSTTTAVVVGAQIIDANSVSFIEAALEKLKARLGGWQIQKVEVKDFDGREINFYTNEGWYVILGRGGDIDEALVNLNNFLRQEEIDSGKLEYVDLRIPDKIFYK
ncbi:MAG TPA: cell division protein FtsQ/DivIB [bacterium]|nr:cell division protein FtsQ/DivIB [bacterium]